MGRVMLGRSQHRDAIALLGAFVLVVVPVWIVREIRNSDNPVDSATLYGAYLGAAALTVPLLVVLGPMVVEGAPRTADAGDHRADPGSG